jgi:nucleotide-binding universal stress UspA family protein
MIGSHGRSALKAAVLGSVTFGVISKESKIPVLVVRK